MPASSTSFQPGKSANPGGRPKPDIRLRDAARDKSPEMLAVLVKIANDPKATPSARVAAANSVLDRGWGKPVQAVTGEDGGPLTVATVPMEAFLAARAAIVDEC